MGVKLTAFIAKRRVFFFPHFFQIYICHVLDCPLPGTKLGAGLQLRNRSENASGCRTAAWRGMQNEISGIVRTCFFFRVFSFSFALKSAWSNLLSCITYDAYQYHLRFVVCDHKASLQGARHGLDLSFWAGSCQGDPARPVIFQNLLTPTRIELNA